MKTPVRYGMAILGLLPAAALISTGVDLCSGEKSVPGENWIVQAVFLALWK